ncbi:MAG: hypothetical protein ABSB22_24045 [Thermodesulfobacteriota bacterium]
MIKRTFLITFSALLLALPLAAWAADIPAKVYENGTNDNPVAVSQAKIEVFAGFGFKGLLSSAESGSNGGCILKNVPLGKDILVKLSKTGFVTQYDIRSYSDTDVGKGVIFWTGSEANLNALYKQLGEAFDTKKGNVYLDISDEITGDGVEGVQLAVSSGKVFGFGNGEYLIANAEGNSLKIGFQKPGYAFDIQSATIPLFTGAMTQYYIKVQSEGAIFASGQAKTGSGAITGTIRTLSGSTLVGLSGVSVAFTFYSNKQTARPSVATDKDGKYIQTGFPLKNIKVTPSKAGYTFKPKSRTVKVKITGVKADFKTK